MRELHVCLDFQKAPKRVRVGLKSYVGMHAQLHTIPYYPNILDTYLFPFSFSLIKLISQ